MYFTVITLVTKAVLYLNIITYSVKCHPQLGDCGMALYLYSMPFNNISYSIKEIRFQLFN